MSVKDNTNELREILNAINNLPSVESGGGTTPAEPVIEPLSVTENGTYTAPNGVDGYSPVVVDVRVPEGSNTPSGTKKITENGTHNVAEYEFADVDVPIPDGYIIPSGTKTITENGTHDAKEFESVDVNVPIPDGYIVPSGALSIEENGEFDVTEYKTVAVNVPSVSGETALGADIYMVYEGQLFDFFTFAALAFPDFGITRENWIVCVADALPDLPDTVGALPVVLITKGDGIKYLRYADENISPMWLDVYTLTSALGMGIPDHGWISMSELEALDYTSAENIGLYAVQRACNPFIERNLLEYSGSEKIIGRAAFSECFALTSIDLPNATSIGDDAFYDCDALTSIDLPNATSIGDNAFAYCDALTSIDLPNATRVGNYAFNGCENLTSINLPVATWFGTNAFYNCSALTTLDLPSATSLNGNAFFGCRELTSLILRANRVCTLTGTLAFYQTPIESGSGYIYVPSKFVNSYKNATNWSAVAEQIRAIEDYPEITGG